MLQVKLPFTATELLLSGHAFEQSILLYAGESEWGNQKPVPGKAASAYLCLNPSKWLEITCKEDIQAFIGQLPPYSESDTNFPVVPGWFGYFSYEAGRSVQLMPHRTPLGEFGFYPLIIHLNLETDVATAIALDELTDKDVKAHISQINRILPPTSQKPSRRQWQAAWSFEQYNRAFDQVQAYLKAGDCYQVNLAMPFSCSDNLWDASPSALLDAFQPRFGGWFRSAKTYLISVSPERFISVHDGCIETRPIKGTVKRGVDAADDELKSEWLSNSAKNRAENLMIVDLLRNDLSLHADTGSVRVPSLFAIETHANVHHMVSTITADLKPGHSSADVIISALPGGSITGAPKIRAMEIIEELEQQPRGAYCGAMGFFGVNGNCDFNILIRTLCITADSATCWGGGGIVVDSEAQDEWQEIFSKVGAILDTPL